MGAVDLTSPMLMGCRELARAMDLFDEAACSALGVSRSDLRALNLLEHGPLRPVELAAELRLTKAAITALIDRLAAAGYVRRTAVPGDRRSVAVELQPATWAAFAAVYRPLGERVGAAIESLSPAERTTVADALGTISAVFAAAGDDVGAPSPGG